MKKGMKKKIIALALVAALGASAAIGGSLAYFTDTDAEDNVFTIGDVDITLNEDFDQNSNLQPGVDVNKDVSVTNSGTEKAYVRVHMAVPKVMDDGNPAFNASQNFLHWNFLGENFDNDGEWSWIPEMTTGAGYKGNGAGNWNYYETKVDGVEYGVYVATYRSELAAGATTPTMLDKVYLDTKVNAKANRDEEGNLISTTYTDGKNTFTLTPEEADNVKIKVFAEATQAAGFGDAYEALNTAIGEVGTYCAFGGELLPLVGNDA